LGIKKQDERNGAIPRTFVEDCFGITPGSFDRYLLRGKSKDGRVSVWRRFDEKKISYQVKPVDKPSLIIQYETKRLNLSQTIPISLGYSPFGEKPYLTCECGYKGKLYLKPGSNYWFCRKCCDLIYELQTFSKRSIAGFLRYHLNRYFKLGIMRAKVKRIEYLFNGAAKYTRKARAVLKMSYKCAMPNQSLKI